MPSFSPAEPDSPAPWNGEGSPLLLHRNIKEGHMSAQKMTNLIDKIAMTFVNAALLAALPLAAATFVVQSL